MSTCLQGRAPIYGDSLNIVLVTMTAAVFPIQTISLNTFLQVTHVYLNSPMAPLLDCVPLVARWLFTGLSGMSNNS
ncbi:hypothetical protein JB92DRAFT_2869083 [Gautieria morchelliformis]|nr:hypothetical protein JB92DRAFT_2869083 [Gautieria morchelliformis]